MTTPSGLLSWGQGGTYDAVDDRAVITALANTRQGLVTAVKLTAGTGLNVTIAPGWLGVANCGDSTMAVVGSRSTLSVAVPAGPATGSATYYLWCDVNPDAATWTINVITPAQSTGRSGILLGTVVAPANSNTAAAMTLTPATVGFGNVEGLVIATSQTGGKVYLYADTTGHLYVQGQAPSTAGGVVLTQLMDNAHRTTANAPDGVTMTCNYAIPAGDVAGNATYVIRAHGDAKTGAQAIWFDVYGLGGITRCTFPANTLPNQAIWFDVEAHVHAEAGGPTATTSIKAWIGSSTVVAPAVAAIGYTKTASIVLNTPSGLKLRSNIGQMGAGCFAETFGSSFQRCGGGPDPQVQP